MSAHGYFSIDKDKIKHMSFFKNGSHNRIRNGWVYKNGVYMHVWSGASVVSYYDNETLLGTEEVDEGEDVLHPSFSTSKEGYTLVGWSTEPNDLNKKVTTLVASGEEMTLYALYVPNTIVVCVSSKTGTKTASTTVWNSRYMSGSAYVIQESPGPSLINTANFGITLHEYQNSSVRLWTYWYMVDEQGYGHDEGGSMKIDSTTRYNGNVLSNLSGVHQMSVHAFPNWGTCERYVCAFGGLANVTLSNPKAWE